MIKEYKSGTLLLLYLRPGSSRSSWEGPFGERYKVKIAAPPVDGAANEELIRFVAKTFGISKSRVEIIRGETSKQKDLYLDLNFIQVATIFNSLPQ